MNLGDPELELIDPTPNVHSLFVQFDEMFFWATLVSRAAVRWSKKMYSCAGVCSYQGRGSLCDIALSEPLLKLRPRKDLVETLLHEMIHAYLFVTNRDMDRDGHGPNFKAHMYRINQTAGLNISIYHNFHEEVRLYKNHVWRCNGPCQKTRPHFGIVRRSTNTAPGNRDYWWQDHQRRCGGTFIKISEPDKPAKKNTKAKDKPNADITKYVTTKGNNPHVPKPVLKDSNMIPVNTKSNSGAGFIVTKTGPVFNPKFVKPPVIFSGKGEVLSDNRPRSNSVGVVETVRNIWTAKNLPSTSSTCPSNCHQTVRNIWANKQIPITPTAACTQNPNKTILGSSKQGVNKHKIDSHADSPPAKMKKIDDYFKNIASTLLKDIYGQDIKIINTNNTIKTVPVIESIEDTNSASPNKNIVDCPVCSAKVSSQDINKHLDECLNREVIENLTKEALPLETTTDRNVDRKSLKNLYGNIPQIPAYVPKTEEIDNMINERVSKTELIRVPNLSINEVTNNLNTALVDIDYQTNVDLGYSPTSLDDVVCKVENAVVKIENEIRNGAEVAGQKCVCCGIKIDKPLEDHLDECLAFFGNNNTIPNESTSTNLANEAIIIDDDDDDILDETQTYNATGTKTPCPCCLQMFEEVAMNDHLDRCLSGDFEEDL